MSDKTTSGKSGKEGDKEDGKTGGNADDTLIDTLVLPDPAEDLADQGAARSNRERSKLIYSAAR